MLIIIIHGLVRHQRALQFLPERAQGHISLPDAVVMSATVDFISSCCEQVGLFKVAWNTALSTYSSLMRVIALPEGLSILKHANLLAIDQRTWSSTAIHIPGAAQLPCPTPRIRLTSFDWYVLADILCPVLIL